MSYENMLREIIEMDKKDREDAEERLKVLCEESQRLKYEDLIERILYITENKTHINSYKITSFILWLAEDLEEIKVINEKYWDMTNREIDEALSTKTLEINEEYSDFFYEYSIDNIFRKLKQEYLHRKNKNLID